MVRDWPALVAVGTGICFAAATASPHMMTDVPRAVALALPLSVPWVGGNPAKADAKSPASLAGRQLAER